MLARSVGVMHPRCDTLREQPYLESELVECFGVVYHYDGVALRYLFQPLKYSSSLAVLVFVVVIAHANGGSVTMQYLWPVGNSDIPSKQSQL